MIDYRIKYPDYFWRDLEQMNAKHQNDAPIALILRAEKQIGDGAIAPPLSHPEQAAILQIAKTHRIALQTINHGAAIGQKIRETAQITGKNPQILMISAHGTPEEIILGNETIWDSLPFVSKIWNRTYGIADVKAEDFSFLASDAQIFLHACDTGSLQIEKNLAETIADVSKRTVWAPAEKLLNLRTLIKPWRDSLRFCAFNDQLAQQIYAFSLGNNPLLYEDSFASSNKNGFFDELVAYTSKHALEGNEDAQLTMGHLCLAKVAGLSDQDAAKWFLLAANQGNVMAQANLGLKYYQGTGGVSQSYTEALRWLRPAAERGHSAAQRFMGLLYEKGLGGLAPSEQQALLWYQKAASQGDCIAQFIMGEAYRKGLKGLAKSDQEAAHWYRQAAEQGDMDSQALLGLYYLEGLGRLEPSHSKAVYWLRQAADQGSEMALMALALLYCEGKEVPILKKEVIQGLFLAKFKTSNISSLDLIKNFALAIKRIIKA